MSSFTASLSTDAWNRPAIGLDTEIGQIGVLDPADVRRGQLTVCSHAVDVAEARELLAMLGIGAEPGRSGNTVRTLPRGECGHVICAGRDRCAWLTTGGRHRGVTSTEERT